MVHGRPVIAKNEPPADLEAFETHALVDKKVVAKFLGVTPRTVENLQLQGLPHYKLTPRRTGYFLDEIREWLVQTRRRE